MQGKLFSGRIKHFHANMYDCVWKELVMVKQNQWHRTKKLGVHLQKTDCVQTWSYTGTLSDRAADKLTHRETIMVVQQPEPTGAVEASILMWCLPYCPPGNIPLPCLFLVNLYIQSKSCWAAKAQNRIPSTNFREHARTSQWWWIKERTHGSTREVLCRL